MSGLKLFFKTDMDCGPIRSAPGAPVEEIVVSGGLTDSGSSAAVEIFNIGTASWRTGNVYTNTTSGKLYDRHILRTANNLGHWAMERGTAVPYGSTFLLVGGDRVYKYIPSSDTWEKILSNPSTMYGVVMLVDLGTFPSC